MKLLETYILRRVGQMFLVALLPVLAIIWTTQVLQRINLVTDSGQSIGSFAKLATMILPSIIPVVLPFALVIAITQTLTTMNNDSELTVIDAAGARRSVLIRPILLLAAVISVFSFFVDNVVEPRAKTVVRQMIAETYADLLSSVIEEKTFRKLDEGLYVQISKRMAGRMLKGLFVADERDPAYELIYYAKEGAVDDTGTTLIMLAPEIPPDWKPLVEQAKGNTTGTRVTDKGVEYLAICSQRQVSDDQAAEMVFRQEDLDKSKAGKKDAGPENENRKKYLDELRKKAQIAYR